MVIYGTFNGNFNVFCLFVSFLSPLTSHNGFVSFALFFFFLLGFESYIFYFWLIYGYLYLTICNKNIWAYISPRVPCSTRNDCWQLSVLTSSAALQSCLRLPEFYWFCLTSYIRLLKETFFFLLFFAFRAALSIYGNSQARGRIIATAAGLHHSHSNTGSKPSLRPTS